MNESHIPAAWLIPALPALAVSLLVAMACALAYILWFNVCEADKARIRRRVRAVCQGALDVRSYLRWLRASSAALLLLGAGVAHAEEKEPVSALMYAGRLVTVAQDDLGKLSRSDDLWAARMVVSAPGPGGLRFGLRLDLTSLSYVDPSSIELSGLRTAEGYGALSWSAKALGVTIGGAAFAGALVPVEAGAVTWAQKWGYGGGLRIGLDSGPLKGSYVYAFIGKDHASDDLAGDGASPARLICPFSIEVPIWRSGVAIQGEYISGNGGRGRAGLMVRVPNPWGE